MIALHRHLVGVLLVLLHMLEPGLHHLQHAAGGCAHGDSVAIGHVGSSCCHADAPTTARATAPGVDLLAPSDSADDYDCKLCSQLQRLHNYIAPSVAAALPATGRRPTPLQGGVVAPHVERISLPPARAPPLPRA